MFHTLTAAGLLWVILAIDASMAHNNPVAVKKSFWAA
jgi:hypothetical protein